MNTGFTSCARSEEVQTISPGDLPRLTFTGFFHSSSCSKEVRKYVEGA